MALTEEQQKSAKLIAEEVVVPAMARSYNQALDEVIDMLRQFQELSTPLLVPNSTRRGIYLEIAKAFTEKIQTLKMPEEATKPPGTKTVTQEEIASKVKFVECDQCDGCGWYEGGPTIRTTCEYCKGTGLIAKPV